MTNFYIGETIKVRCNMAYRRSNSSLFLLAEKIELISIVNVITSLKKKCMRSVQKSSYFNIEFY